MSRIVEITVPPQRTDALLQEIRGLEELIGLRAQRGVSVQPPGDLITVAVTNRALLPLIRLLDESGVIQEDGASVSINEPAGLISLSVQEAIESDESDIVWEEMEFSILRESNMDVNGMLVMITAGVLAAVGVATGAVHLVIGGMVIAPGFKPISRISLGLVARGHESWRHGVQDTFKAYAALAAGALVAAMLLRLTGRDLLAGAESYLPTEQLIEFWLEISLPALLVAACAGGAGAVLIAVNRSVLTAGVMIALALIPPLAIAGLAAVAGEFQMMGRAVLRWAIEVAVVAATGVLVFLWKRMTIQQRRMVM
jgi:hypothetical protein